MKDGEAKDQTVGYHLHSLLIDRAIFGRWSFVLRH